jgi:SAM-dependent methyltransferase
LTQAHAAFAEKITGVDISGPMIAQARHFNRLPEQIDFQVNTKPDLSMFADDHFDYIISHIVLQHVPAPIHLGYLREFVRVLRPGGVCIFQLPEDFTADWGSERFTEENKDKIDMYCSPKDVVIETLGTAGGRLLEIEEDGACGPLHTSYRYVFTKD